MTADLILKGGKVVAPDAVIEASVAIKDERIIAVGTADAMPSARETVDVSGMHLLPGAIDVHVHFRDPRLSAQGRLRERHLAAAFGGVTTVFDMPNTIPTVGTPERSPPSTRWRPRRRISITGSTPCSAKTRSRRCRR
jgi:dihydroorotase